MDTELTHEEWRDIPGFPGYQASSWGRLRSLARMAWNPRGRGYSFWKKERILTSKPDKKCGYLSHSVYSAVQPEKQTFLAHRLVALAFIPNPESKAFVNHKSGVKTDNRPCNLEWCTKPENGAHAVAMGLHTPLRGEANGHSRLTSAQVLEIRQKYGSGQHTTPALAKEFGIGTTTVGYIINRKLWAHI
jgi:hypothetical protein